jgi:hypothetical protein
VAQRPAGLWHPPAARGMLLGCLLWVQSAARGVARGLAPWVVVRRRGRGSTRHQVSPSPASGPRLHWCPRPLRSLHMGGAQGEWGLGRATCCMDVGICLCSSSALPCSKQCAPLRCEAEVAWP